MQITITNAGRAALVNAGNSGTLPITVASVGISATAVTPDETATSLPGEFKRITDVSGSPAAADTMHLIVRDTSADVYNMKSYALYLTDGTLFAIYGQATDIIDKVAASTMLMAVDIKFANIDATSIAFGDTNFLNPPATTTTKGVVELATDAEALAGTDPTRAITPETLSAVLALFAKLTGAQFTGDVIIKGSAGVERHLIFDVNGVAAYIYLNESAIGLYHGTWGVIWSMNFADGIFRVSNQRAWHAGNDGAGSGLDADLLDGQHGSFYADVISRLGFTPVNAASPQMSANPVIAHSGDVSVVLNSLGIVIARLAAQSDGSLVLYRSNGGPEQAIWTTDGINFNCAIPLLRQGNRVWDAGNDGAGSGLDADLLDGRQASDFALMSGFDINTAATGYQKLPSGLIIQWGHGGVTDSSGIVDLNFPIAFPNGCLSATATNDSGGLPTAWASVGNFTRFGMRVGNVSAPSVAAGAGTAFYWMAIGV
jgi:hypothetical protein